MKQLFLIILVIVITFGFADGQTNEVLSKRILALKKPSKKAIEEIELIDFEINAWMKKFEVEISKYYKENGNSVGFKYNSKKQLELLKNYILSDHALIVKQFAALQIPKLMIKGGIKFGKEDANFKNVCSELIPPDDIMWSLNPDAILFFGNFSSNRVIVDFLKKISRNGQIDTTALIESNDMIIAKQKQTAYKYREDIIRENPSKVVRAKALIGLMDIAYLFQDYEKANICFETLNNEYIDVKGVKEEIVQYNPHKLVIPEFSLTNIRTTETISPTSLRGKTYLIQFWSTSCASCIAEMKELHEVYEKFRNSDFTIVSVALGDSLGRLKKFWNEKWEMPWKNVLLEKGYKSEMAKTFNITYVPKLLLVGRTGKILENNFSFKRKNIESVINKHIQIK